MAFPVVTTSESSLNVKGSSNSQTSSGKTKLKFVLLTEHEFRHHDIERELYGYPILSSKSPFPQLPPHNPSDFIFKNNSWVHSTILPRQYLEEETLISPQPTNSLPNGDVDSIVQENPSSNEPTDDEFTLKQNKPKIWRHPISCVLCKGEDENSLLGRLLIIPSRGQWIHSNCLKCSEGIYETPDGVLEGSEYLLKRYISIFFPS